MAYAKACTTPVSIKVNNLTSKPYIDLTLGILDHFGFKVENDRYERFNILRLKTLITIVLNIQLKVIGAI